MSLAKRIRIALLICLTLGCAFTPAEEAALKEQRLGELLGLSPRVLLARLEARVLPRIPEAWGEDVPMVNWEVLSLDEGLEFTEAGDVSVEIPEGLEPVIGDQKGQVWALYRLAKRGDAGWPVLRISPDGATTVEAGSLRDFLALTLHELAEDPDRALAAREAWLMLRLGHADLRGLLQRVELAQEAYADLERSPEASSADSPED